MKKFFTTLALAALALLPAVTMRGADTPQKHEMRSAWVATVWRLDWPSTVITSTGNENQITRQKNEMIRLLDSLQVNNMNAVNFQVRSRCDAMYKSSFEPWSADLVSERGLDPGYDPLQFVVEECHKRGMECHAWLNPYRFESVIEQWSGLPGDYRKDHPDWLLDVKGASILNPGRPEVTQLICDIIAEIITNYDVDGVLFDDYFYLSGTTSDQDGDLYAAYKAEGGTLSQNDWRRDNVNHMVAAVYKTIKDIKPYVRFGVSPAGIACTSSSVARKYGISPCPTGSDWQYNDIYSDPIAWISQQSLDFISPQIYWTIGNGTDYDKATKWWSEVANKWNRHLYVSHSISSLTGASKANGVTGIENDKVNPLASGPNSESFEEYANQIRLNRQYTLNNAPGSIFYSCKYLYSIAPLFAHYLKTTVFNTPALMPALTWLPVANPGNVSNVARAGNKLTWNGQDNVRYTVYAVPSSVDPANFSRDVEYLLGVSYENSYTIPEKYLAGYNFAVCVYDRYANEYNPVFVGATAGTLPAPTLVSPATGESIEQPFDFKWNPVDKATNYIIEISDKDDMSSLLYVKAVDATSCGSSEFYHMPIQQTLYWRVRACGNNFNDGVSAIQPFVALNLEVTSPATDAVDVPLCPELTWTFPERDVTIQLSTADDFAAGTIFFEQAASGGKFVMPKYVLAYSSTYYLRLLYTRNGEECISPVVAFSTVVGTPEIPTVAYPINGGTLYKNDNLAVTPIEGAKAIRLEVSSSSTFPARSSYIQSAVDMQKFVDPKTGEQIALGSKKLVDGETYYVRARAQYATEDGSANTEYSPVSTFVYSAQENAVNDITADTPADNAPVETFSIDGRKVTNPATGVYIERRGTTTTKILVK